eukprot:SAG22_NODE_11053_length_503_cov_0.759901_2_plen_70_part_01
MAAEEEQAAWDLANPEHKGKKFAKMAGKGALKGAKGLTVGSVKAGVRTTKAATKVCTVQAGAVAQTPPRL